MAGDKKAGKKRNKASAKRYLTGKRWLVNKEKRIAKENARQAKGKDIAVPKGAARKARRAGIRTTA